MACERCGLGAGALGVRIAVRGMVVVAQSQGSSDLTVGREYERWLDWDENETRKREKRGRGRNGAG